jgi:integrase
MHQTGKVAAELSDWLARRRPYGVVAVVVVVRHARLGNGFGNVGMLTRRPATGCVTALSAAFRHGERNLGAVRRNPVRDLDRGHRPSAKRESEPRYLAVSEVGTLLGKMTDDSRPVAAALFYGALRVSEALAMVWADVDFKNATLTVRGRRRGPRGR